jgi:hypothetical protein
MWKVVAKFIIFHWHLPVLRKLVQRRAWISLSVERAEAASSVLSLGAMTMAVNAFYATKLDTHLCPVWKCIFDKIKYI